jgi:predicted dehydrogenase
MTRRLRLGMVGGGEGAFIGAVHRIAARIDDRFELVAGALSSDPQRAASSAAAIGIARSYADFREMARTEAAREDGIDAVAIVTPNHLHARIATAFLEAGIHVICDKPLAVSLDEGEALARLAREKGLVFAVTYTYTGYPLVRHARALVQAGALGDVRLVNVEYAQDWLSLPVEHQSNRQAAWRTNPALAGPAGCLGDIGTHAYQLAEYVTGMRPSEVSAELATFVPNRPIDDHVQAMLRYANGARGMLWASQVAAGEENALRLRVYGTKAGLSFDQQNPNELWITPLGGASERITRGRVQSAEALHATRVPAGHPEGYLEAFAQLYTDAASCIEQGATQGDGWLTTVDDGVAGLHFIDAVLTSSRANAAWVTIE